MPKDVLTRTEIPEWNVRRGKVRDIYDLGNRLLIVSTDRISAFDWILPTPIPDKGRVLTQISAFWFKYLDVPHHLLSVDVSDVPWPAGFDPGPFEGRTMLVRKANVIPIECVARGYLAGSGWKEYQRTGMVCGINLPNGMSECEAFETPIFTPTTKAESGHDENICFGEMEDRIGSELAERLRQQTLEIYHRGAKLAREKGMIVADTKLEWGIIDEDVILVDEVLTPDSSRFWPANEYSPGRSQFAFDKQYVRDWLEKTPWDKNSPPPTLPDEVVEKTRARYIEAFETLTGSSFRWK